MTLSSYSNQKGQILIYLLVFGAVAIYSIGGFSLWASSSITASRQAFQKELAVQIAEAGIDYYRWHLAHAPTDFQDGTGQPGPYIHDFEDKDGNVIGQFILDITAPPIGSTLVKIESTGKVSANPNISRTIIVQLAKPSFAKYAVVSNSLIQFGGGTEVWGPVHSNGGIAFNGVAMHNLVTSSVPPSGYDDPAHSGGLEWGVHTHVNPVDPLPPTPMPQHPVFMAGRQVGVPAVDFAGITTDLEQMKADAIANGKYYANSSSGLGYHIVLKNTGHYDIFTVNTLVLKPSGCNIYIRYLNPTDANCTAAVPVNSMWSWNTQTLLDGNVSFPDNGIIFAEDHVWVDGQIDEARITIVAALVGALPASQKNIIVNNDLLYTNYDGKDVIGLIAQNDIIIGFKSLNTQRVDAALIAQNGRLHRYYYKEAACGVERVRNQITFYGMLATNQRYALLTSSSSTCNNGSSGYSNRDFIYDPNLLYAPPPSFPLTSDQYITLSFEEIM